jgi:SAM-dependent methyltransferase
MTKINDLDGQGARWDLWAPYFDADSVGHLDLDEAVEALASVAGDGPVLELGIGSGRLALPLAKSGLRVDGIDASSKMIARLQEQRGDLHVRAWRADMADFVAENRYSLVFVAASTIFLLETSARQLACFRCAAAALTPGGRFVVEASTPAAVAGEQQVIIRHADHEHVRLTLQTHVPELQQVFSQELQVHTDGTFRMLPSMRRYASPSELDLMAELAGLRLYARYGGWDLDAFTGASRRHLSVYGSPTPSTASTDHE